QFLGVPVSCGSVFGREQNLDRGTQCFCANSWTSPLFQFMTDRHGRGLHLSLREAEQRETGMGIATRLARASIQLLGLLKFSSQPLQLGGPIGRGSHVSRVAAFAEPRAGLFCFGER